MNSGRLPTEEEGLSVLVRRPLDWPKEVLWMSCLDTEVVPCDAWGNAYVYVLDANLPAGFGIYSCGQDGMTFSNGNDLDDVNTWNHAKPWAAYYAKQRRIDQIRRLATPLAVTLLVVAGMIALAWAASKPGHPAV